MFDNEIKLAIKGTKIFVNPQQDMRVEMPLDSTKMADFHKRTPGIENHMKRLLKRGENLLIEGVSNRINKLVFSKPSIENGELVFSIHIYDETTTVSEWTHVLKFLDSLLAVTNSIPWCGDREKGEYLFTDIRLREYISVNMEEVEY